MLVLCQGDIGVLGSLFKRFHREESAQISFLAIAGVVCFVGLLSMIINTDDIITDRVYMQDVADTTAISSAAWTARGLNMISFINVMNSKLISTAVLLNALADTLEATRIVGEIQRGIFQACSGVPFVGAFCAAYAAVLNVQLAVLQPLEEVVDGLADSLSRCDQNGALWSVMNALQAAATAVKESFTLIGIAESIDMAKANGADFGLVVNGNMLSLDDAASLLSLPVKEAEFATFCPFVKNGGSGYKMAGYECGEGPFKVGKDRIMATILLPFANMFAHPIFIGMSASHFSQVGCTADPDPENDSFEVTLKDHNECRQYDQEAQWSHLYSRTGPLTDGTLGTDDFVAWRPLQDYAGGKDADDAPDQGEIEDQLGEINVPAGQPGSAGGNNVTMGPHYGDLIPGSEVALRDGFDVDCNGQRYPIYAPPPAGFNSDQPGDTLCFLNVGSECRRIDEWGQFTWYSGNHIKNGPKDIGGYFMRVGKRTIEPPEDEPDTPTKYVYIVETVSLVGAGTKEMSQQEFEDYMNQNNQTGEDLDTEASSSSSGCTKPEPYVLDKEDSGDNEDFYNKLRFMSVVYRDISDDRPFWSNYFDEPPEALVAYSQAQVYNHLAEDTFTQDWRVRLEQASLLEKLVDSGKMPGGGLGQFGNVISTINNH
jgi:hypothetical protein